MYIPIPFPQINRMKSLDDLRKAMGQPEATAEEVDDVQPAWRTQDALFGALPTLLLALTGHGKDAGEFAKGYLGGKLSKAQSDTAKAQRKALTDAQRKNTDRQRAIDLAQLNYNIADQDYKTWQNRRDLEQERQRQKEAQDANKPKPDPLETDDFLLDDFLEKASQGGRYTKEDLLNQLRINGTISPERYKQYLSKLEEKSPLHPLKPQERTRAKTWIDLGLPQDRAAKAAQQTSFMGDAGAQAMAFALNEVETLRQQYPDLAAGSFRNLPPHVLQQYESALRRVQGIVQAQAAPFHQAEQDWARQLSAAAMDPVRLSILMAQRPLPKPGLKRYQDMYNDFHNQIGALPRR